MGYNKLKVNSWIFLIAILFAKASHGQMLSKDSIAPINQIVNAASMAPFYKALNNRDKQKVHILQLGDSHIQMGYLSEQLRLKMDSLYRIDDFGATFPYQIAKHNTFYTRSKVNIGKWTWGSVLNDKTTIKSGFSGFWVNTSDTVASMQFALRQQDKEKENFSKVSIFFKSDDLCTINLRAYNMQDSSVKISPIYSTETEFDGYTGRWRKLDVVFSEQVNRLLIEINNPIPVVGFTLYGLSLENSEESGLMYSACGVGGAQFKHFAQNSLIALEQIKELSPDLLIFSYGSNESYISSFTAEAYGNMLHNLVQEIRQIMPHACILFTGPPDTRSHNIYPRNANAIAQVLTRVAITENCAFWDLRKQMGGENSIYQWLKKGLAAKDQLHFTKKGYYLQAEWLSEAINNAYESFNQTVKNE
jgi:hypothetical protein